MGRTDLPGPNIGGLGRSGFFVHLYGSNTSGSLDMSVSNFNAHGSSGIIRSSLNSLRPGRHSLLAKHLPGLLAAVKKGTECGLGKDAITKD